MARIWKIIAIESYLSLLKLDFFISTVYENLLAPIEVVNGITTARFVSSCVEITRTGPTLNCKCPAASFRET